MHTSTLRRNAAALVAMLALSALEVGCGSPGSESGRAARTLAEAGGQPPLVTGVSPGWGPPYSGFTTVTVHGSGFDMGSQVYFGDTPALMSMFQSESMLEVWTPDLEPGVYDVRVEDMDLLSGTLVGAYTVSDTGVAVQQPRPGDRYESGSAQAIVWDSSGVSSMTVELWSEGALYATLASGVDAYNGWLDWTVPVDAPAGPGYTIRLVDEEGVAAVAVSGAFSVAAPSVTSLAASNLAPVEETPVTFTATVTAGGAPVEAGGSVVFQTTTSRTLGSAVVDELGVATFTTADLYVGAQQIIASYQGGTSAAASSSDPLTVVVSLPAGSSVTNLGVSGGSASYVSPGAPVVIDPAVTVESDSNIDTARVFVSTGFVAGEDVLAFPGAPGITGSYDPLTGVLSLVGTASAADYQAALRTVTYANGAGPYATVGPRQISFSLGSGLLFSGSGHFYKYVARPGIRWDTASAEASARSYFGLQGYLATVTSAEENQFIQSKLKGNGWMGASTPGFVLPRTWSWVTGPEAGTAFFTQTTDQAGGGGGGTAIGGRYANWASGEPNTWSGSENYAHFYANNGTWNDFAGDSPSIEGYVVEFGGMAGDPTPVLSGVRSLDLSIATFSVSFETDGTPGASLSGDLDQIVTGGLDSTAVTAIAPATHFFAGWTGTGGFTSPDNPLVVTGVLSDMTVHASFAPRAAQTISFSLPASATFGDGPLELAVLATGGASGEPVTFSVTSGPGHVSGTQLFITGAGQIVVTASQAGTEAYLPAEDVEASLVVGKAAASVTLASLAQTYTGTARSATATTTPPGLTVSFTYDGSGTAPTVAGSYAVVGTIVDDNYQGSASGTLVVGKAAASVTLASLAQTYDGTPKVVTATTVPPELAVTLTYDGSLSPPVAAGSYAVVGTIDDDNYQGSAAATLAVAQGSAWVEVASSRPISRRGRPVTFTASVSSPGVTPTGTVVFRTGGTELGTAPVEGGVATITVRSLTKSDTPWPITADYGGSDDVAPASGTLEGGQVVENSPPVAGAGTALSLGATAADAVAIAAAGALDTDAFTVEAWAKATWTSLDDVRGPSPTILSLGSGDDVRLALGVLPDRSALTVTFGGATLSIPAPIDDQAWHHLAVASVDGEVAVYVDGRLFERRAGSLSGAGVDLVLGREFTGELDEVRAWSVARDVAAIEADSRRPLRGDEAGLIGYWRMDEGGGAELFDASASFLDGAVALAGETAQAFAPSAAWARRQVDQDHAMTPADAGYDVDGDALTLAISTEPQYGTASIDPEALRVGYQPAAGYLGSDSLAFSLDDGAGPVSYTLELDVGRVLVCEVTTDCGGGDVCVSGQCRAPAGGGCGCGSGGAGAGALWGLLGVVALLPLRRRRRG